MGRPAERQSERERTPHVAHTGKLLPLCFLFLSVPPVSLFLGDACEFTGKDILIIGTSYSAEDIASQCYKYGEHILINILAFLCAWKTPSQH
jgi:hypothetical protein